MLKLEIKMRFDSKEEAKNFFKSIEPELIETFSRSETKISQKEKVLLAQISASDKAAMRASLNSIMKPLKLFNELEELK